MSDYYQLTKPGIVYGNALTAVAGFLFASRGHVNVPVLIAMLAGVMGVIASACVLNNIIDRDVDARMERTKDRALPAGRISVRNAFLYALALGAVGFAALYFFTNTLAVAVAAFGVASYVGLYTPAKRVSVHSTIIGALPGAVPPVIGYVAVTNAFDLTALCLFLILVSWQMVHFFAIAIYRIDEYRAAGLPVMPVRLGTLPTKALMATHTVVFALALYALYAVHGLPLLSVLLLTAAALGWIALVLYGFYAKDERRWAKRAFLYSLIVLLLLCAVLALP